MARRTTVGSVTGALIDSMEVVSNVAGTLSDSVAHVRTAVEGLGYKAHVFRESAKLDAQIELGKMKSDKTLAAKVDLAKQKAEVQRLMQTDKELAAVWNEVDAEVNKWFE
ncbi:gp001 [Erwinia phage vB_EamP-S6]|uniref:Gp001 n=1 Tax=Erwinia phage vB_EamP-S6 TaxID=1051675 RepID=G0YQ93_9CAUD|nr:gp001 [Erwinia phage vB_EamP-S6]AEJ81520.1 gp001 [Erwinia phage vB_EamP-S6]